MCIEHFKVNIQQGQITTYLNHFVLTVRQNAEKTKCLSLQEGLSRWPIARRETTVFPCKLPEDLIHLTKIYEPGRFSTVPGHHADYPAVLLQGVGIPNLLQSGRRIRQSHNFAAQAVWLHPNKFHIKFTVSVTRLLLLLFSVFSRLNIIIIIVV